METLTHARPKALLPILDRPIIAHVLDGFYEAGIRQFTVVVGENDGAVPVWINENWHPDARVRYVLLGHKRGTASPVFAARNHIDGPFILSTCQAIYSSDHLSTMCAYFTDHSRDSGQLAMVYDPAQAAQASGILCDPQGRVLAISENSFGIHQAGMMALPLYAFGPDLLGFIDRVPPGVASGKHALFAAVQMMIDSGHIFSVMEVSHRIRLENTLDFLTANISYLQRHATRSLHSDLPPSVTVTPPVYVDRGVIVGHNVEIGPNVYLERGTVLGNKVTLRNAVVLGQRIRANHRLENTVVSQPVE